MKIEQLIVQHFYNNRKVTLQGMGSFQLSQDVILPAESDKDLVLPENAITFEFDRKAGIDDSLIDFIVAHTRKIKPLAISDLESFLMLGLQFLNIGKPFKLEGIGFLEKKQDGLFHFVQSYQSHVQKEVTATVLKEKKEDEISFAAERKTSPGDNKNAIVVIAVVAVILLAGIAAWYFLIKKDKAAAQTNNAELPISTDSKIVTDTLAKPVAVPNPVKSPYTFRLVFKENATAAQASAKVAELKQRNHDVIMYTTDSINYKLAEVFTLPLSDTAKIKDSLNKFYYSGKGKIELN